MWASKRCTARAAARQAAFSRAAICSRSGRSDLARATKRFPNLCASRGSSANDKRCDLVQIRQDCVGIDCTVHAATRSRESRRAKQLQSDFAAGAKACMPCKAIHCKQASGRPFALRMADGRQYPVPHRDYISPPPRASYVIVMTIPAPSLLLTMTGLQSNVT